MMHALLNRVDLVLRTEADTTAFGRWLALVLNAGDAVLLSGPIGAGKTHIARALVQRRLGDAVEVPSPTFTLVQPYDDEGLTILHADLYRVRHPDEVMELGLEDAMQNGIALIEWPDRLGSYRPQDALEITIVPHGEGRRITAQGPARLINHIASFSARRG